MYIDGRNALSISMTNINEATGRSEVVNLVTTQTNNGDLLFVIAVSPESDYSNYQNVFQNVLRSIRLNE